ncbi:PelD GGDEF domain-containing protein [Noviherbaspirillum pedocola]|nr:PelD GGDEF domain-containing protein [Noviherbaspirillum pedocola]
MRTPAAPSIAIPRRSAGFSSLARRLFRRGGVEGTSGWAGAALEAILLCYAWLAFAVWMTPSDPFGLAASFPWVWLMPALVAMRYGSGAGVFSALLILAAWFAFPSYGLSHADPLAAFPNAYFLGGLALVLVCGQFSDVWNARNRRLRAVNAYLDERLNTLTKNHFLLRLSHERLEQDLLTRPLTLRETLQRLRDNSLKAGAEGLPAVQDFLQLLAQSCQLEIAAVHALDAAGRPLPAPAAAIGAPDALALDDPLLRFAIERQALSHVQSEGLTPEGRGASRYLICAPLAPSRGAAIGLLVVERLPFFALNDDLLKLLTVLIGYYADGVEAGAAVRGVHALVPSCPPALALDLVRLSRIRAEVDIASALVALVFEKSDPGRDMYELVRRTRRGVDIAWELERSDRRIIITLLPLAGEAAVEGYLRRIEIALHAQHGVDFLSGHVVPHIAMLGDDAPEHELALLVERCGA